MTKKEEIEAEVFHKYLEIKQDIINNLDTVFNKQLTYTKKYRGNILTDINVGFFPLDYDNHAVQIFVRHGEIWVRDRLIFNKRNKYVRSDIKSKLRYE